MFKKIVLLLAIFALPSLYSETVTFVKKYDKSLIKKATNNGFTTVEYPELLPLLSEAGSPSIPFDFINILLPSQSATEIKVTVTGSFEELYNNVTVFPTQMQTNPHLPKPPFTQPDPTFYQSTKSYPVLQGEFAGTNEMRGLNYISVKTTPFQYLPTQNKVLFCSELEIKLDYKVEGTTRSSINELPSKFANALKGSVINPEQYTSYNFAPKKRATTFEYIIITNDSLAPTFQQLADFRSLHNGYTTKVMTVNEILSIYPNACPGGGTDTPTAIRNCIIDHVNNYGTEFVAIGGDDTIVPVRYCFSRYYSTVETQMPTDLYYSCLNGDWDSNRNRTYGEIADQIDMTPDVFVGRIPVRYTFQAENYISKLKTNEMQANTTNRTLFTGTECWDRYTGYARPSDAMNDGLPGFRQHNNVSDAEMWLRRMHRDYLQKFGFKAEPFNLLTDSLTTWDQTTENSWSYNFVPQSLTKELNKNHKFVFYAGHGAPQSWSTEFYDEPFTPYHVSKLNGLADTLYTITCLSGHFDKSSNTIDGWPYSTEPSVSEAFIRQKNGGALIYIGCSRFGWGYRDVGVASPNSVGGTSFEYGQLFFKEVLENNKTIAGEAFALHKSAMSSRCKLDNTERWVQFGLNLQGDPAHEITLSGLPKTTAQLTINEMEGGTVNIASGQFSTKESYPLIATSNSGSSFERWVIVNGDAQIEDSLKSSTNITIYGDATIAPIFRYGVDMTVLVVNGEGTVSNSIDTFPSEIPVGIRADEPVTLTATPKEGYAFDSWEVMTGEVDILLKNSAQITLKAYTHFIIKATFTESMFEDDFTSHFITTDKWESEAYGPENWKWNSDEVYFTGSYGNSARLISQEIDLSQEPSPKLSFDYKAEEDWYGDVDEMKLYYRTDSNSQWKTVPEANITTTFPSKQTLSYALPEPSKNYQISFLAKSKGGTGVFVDNVKVSKAKGDNQFIVFTQVTGGGYISPKGLSYHSKGENLRLSLTPKIGHEIKSFTINGEPQSLVDNMYLWDINSDKIVSVEFGVDTFNIQGWIKDNNGNRIPNVSFAGGGQANSNGIFNFYVEYGSNFELKPILPNYHLNMPTMNINMISKDYRGIEIIATPLILTEEAKISDSTLLNNLLDAGITGIDEGNLDIYRKTIMKNFTIAAHDPEKIQEIVNAINNGEEIVYFQMHHGWNLIHFPSETPISIDATFANCKDAAWIWDKDGGCYKSTNVFCAGEGIWLFWDKESEFLSVTSTQFTRDNINMEITPGWNLVGIPDPIIMNDTLAPTANNLMWEWDAENGQYIDVSEEIKEPGKGYWIFSVE